MSRGKSKSGQGAKFREAAREVECDEDEAIFEDALRRIAKPKPPPEGGKPTKEKPGH